MIFSVQLSDLKRVFFVSVVLISTTACTGTLGKSTALVEPDQVSKIQFIFDDDTAVFGEQLSAIDISSQVTANLVQAGYSIATQNTADYSHDLVAKIGAIKKSATPVGFSFTAGNSDPRASNFQKASVLPIRCSLSSRGQKNNQAEYSMDFASEKFLKYVQQPSEQSKLVDLLVDNISTTCFNLLSNLKLKTQLSKHKEKRLESSWMPAIIIENDSAVEKAGDSTKIETIQSQNSARKRIVIHNQGSPVTLEMGHVRR